MQPSAYSDESGSSSSQAGSGMPRSIDPRLMQAYAELPDLADIKTCIDTTTDEIVRQFSQYIVNVADAVRLFGDPQTSYVKQVTFIVKQELEMLWIRICGLQASTGELAYMYAYLALAGYCTMSNRVNLAAKPDLLSSILGPRSCKRHADIAAKLLDYSVEKDRGDNAHQRITDPIQAISQHPYDFRNLANCPPLLLRCLTQLQLLSYHWHAHHYKEAYQFNIQAVASARNYCLFALVQAADQRRIGLDPNGEITEDQWNTPSLRFVAGLRRLHTELSALTHMCTFPLMVPVSLSQQELCQDNGESNFYGAEDLRVPTRQYSQAAKMQKAILKSTAVSKLLEIEAVDYDRLSWSLKQQMTHKGLSTPCKTAEELRIQAFSKLDLDVQAMLKDQQVPVETCADAPSWRSKPVCDAMEAAYANFTLYKRFDGNRIRFELLSRLVGSYAYVPALQGIAMEAAMDTLMLLGKA